MTLFETNSPANKRQFSRVILFFWLPLLLLACAKETAPAPSREQAVSTPPPLELPEVAITDQDAAVEFTQKALFSEIVELIETRYVYPNYNGVDWEALKTAQAATLTDGAPDENFYTSIDEMIAVLNDEHSAYLSLQEVAESNALQANEPSFAGIGLSYSTLSQANGAVVQYTFPNSPAARSGIQAHDVLLAANGNPLCCDANGLVHAGLIRGPANSDVTVTVQSPGQPPRDIIITRAPISGGAEVVTRRLDGNLGYMLIPNFFENEMGGRVITAWEALTAAGPLNGLILDLRINGGGWIDNASDTLSLFLNGTAGTFQQHENTFSWEISGIDSTGSQSVPLVLLVGEQTNSAAEMVTGALLMADRATVVGTATSGNIERVDYFTLSDDSVLTLAVDQFIPPAGQNWEETGIAPDVFVSQAWHEFNTDATDEALQTARNLLQNQ